MQHPLDYAVASIPLAITAGSVTAWVWLLKRLAATHQSPIAYEPRMQVPWSGIDIAWLGAAWLLLEWAAANIDVAEPGSEPGRITLGAVAAVGAIRTIWIAFAVAYLSRAAGAYSDDMGFDTRKLKYDLRLAGVTFLIAALPVYATQLILTQVFDFQSKHPLVELAHEYPTSGVLWVVTLVAVGVAPLVEEFLFRVVIQGWLEKKQLAVRARHGGNPQQPAGWGPIVIAAVIFALPHASHGPDVVALFVLSMFLGYVYQRTHRIIAPVAVHMCVNSLAMLELWRAYLSGST